MVSMPTLTRGVSDSKSKSPPQRQRSNSKSLGSSNHDGSNHGKPPKPVGRSSSGSGLTTLVRNMSSGGSRPDLDRNVSGSSTRSKNSRTKSPVRRENSDNSRRKFKKTQGFDDGVSQCLKQNIEHSPILSQPKDPLVTYFSADQVVRGGKFHSGEFYEFLRVKRLPMQKNTLLDDSDPFNDDSDENSGSDGFQQQHQQQRQYLIKQVKQKHALKAIVMQQATLRLVFEAKFLARLNHPNLVQLRGLTYGEEEPLLNGGCSTFFMVMESCVETLEERIERWKKDSVDEGRFDLNSPEIQQKMKYALDLASALDYLHERNIVLLNLRPENIGFLEDDTIQIRDLTCCRETAMDTVPIKSLDEGWKLELDTVDKNDPLGFMCEFQAKKGDSRTKKGDAESEMLAAKSNFLVLEAAVEGQPRPRFVAPEAVMDFVYTPAADTYSWAHVLYNMLTLNKPYAAYKLGMLLTKVWVEGSRPNVSTYGFPEGLSHLLQISWRNSYEKRPPMKALLQAIPLLLKMSAQGA